MPGHDVGPWLFRVPADAVEEIAVMRLQVGPAALLRDRLVFRTVQLPANRVADDQHPLGAVERGTVLVSLLHVRRPDPLLEDELLAHPRLALDRVFKDRVLRVRPLLVVIEEVLAAQACRPAWVCRRAQAPDRDVDVVYAVVADIPAAKVLEPPPPAGEHVLPVRDERGRAAPGVIIQARRRILRLDLADVRAELAVPGLGDHDLADLTAPDPLHGLDHRGGPRGCCATSASRHRHACPRRGPGWRRGSASGRGWR